MNNVEAINGYIGLLGDNTPNNSSNVAFPWYTPIERLQLDLANAHSRALDTRIVDLALQVLGPCHKLTSQDVGTSFMNMFQEGL